MFLEILLIVTSIILVTLIKGLVKDILNKEDILENAIGNASLLMLLFMSLFSICAIAYCSLSTGMLVATCVGMIVGIVIVNYVILPKFAIM